MRSRQALKTLIVLAALLQNCAVQVVHFADPDAFARNLFRIAREGSASEWGTQLTADRRAQGSTYVRTHFEAWSRLFAELEQGVYGGNLDLAQFREHEGALEFRAEDQWHHLIRVTMEDGGWKVNQD